MSKFTPGPWGIAQNAMEHWMVTAADSEHHRGYIASLATTNTQSEANARLIAAAPQMLEALEELVELKERRHSLPVEIYQESREKAWNKCRAAIAAAKGEV